MIENSSYVHDLALVLGVAATTGVVFRVFKQPSILGYLLAGVIVGPYIPFFFANHQQVQALSELGVVLVMFVIGLEFQITRLLKILPIAGFSALIQIGTLCWSGFILGSFLGWSQIESIILAASIAISSTMIVTKIFEERKVEKELRRFVLGILVLQDLAAIALITATTALVNTGSISATGIGMTFLKLIVVLLIWVGCGLLIVPRLFRWIVKSSNQETIVVASVGLCFVFAMLAEALSYSVALGAFVAGLLVAESGRSLEIEHFIHPVKDIFAAIFFVSIGMTVNPSLAIEHLGTSLLVFLVIVVAQFSSVSFSGLLSGKGSRLSLSAGLALGQIGEFAFIIASIGVTAGVVRESIQPILVTAAVLTAFTTPKLLGWAPKVLRFFDRITPQRLKSSLSVYESWFPENKKRTSPNRLTKMRRALYAIIFDAAVWISILFVGVYWRVEIENWLSAHLSQFSQHQSLALVIILVVASAPPCIGIARNTFFLSETIIEQLVKRRSQRASGLSETSRAFLRSSIRLAVILGLGIPAAAVLRPAFTVSAVAPLVLLAVLFSFVFFWRSAGRLDAEIRSEAERLVDFMAKQRSGELLKIPPKTFFPDLDQMEGVVLETGHRSIGMNLIQLNLRALTGTLVVAIHRDEKDIVMPKGTEFLQPNDLVLLTGTTEGLAQARALLTGKSEIGHSSRSPALSS